MGNDRPVHRAGAALQAAAPTAPRLPSALIVGAGGALGSALVGEALAPGRFRRVGAVVAAPVRSAARAFVALPAQALRDGDAAGAELAFVVLERERRSNRRDEAFVHPCADDLPALAGALRRAGVDRLVVVVPHAPALLPQALQHGFAAEAELEVSRLGFEQVVFLRAAQAADGSGSGTGLRRVAGWWLAQLGLMVAPREQPVRTPVLAALVARLGGLLPLAAPGTRVLPPALLWKAAQGDADKVLAEWLERAPTSAPF